MKVPVGGRHPKVHCDVGERGLEANPCGDVHVEEEFLKTLPYIFIGEVVILYERGQQCVEIAESLCSGSLPLECVEVVHHLAQGGSQM